VISFISSLFLTEQNTARLIGRNSSDPSYSIMFAIHFSFILLFLDKWNTGLISLWLLLHPFSGIVTVALVITLWSLWWDIVESFFKRKKNIPSWQSWYVWDQIDYIIWVILFTLPFHRWRLWEVIFCLVVWGAMSYLFHYIAYRSRLIETKH